MWEEYFNSSPEQKPSGILPQRQKQKHCQRQITNSCSPIGLVQPGRNYGSKNRQRSQLLCSASKKPSEIHQWTGKDSKILSLWVCNYSPAKYTELGVPECISEALGTAEEITELHLHSTKPGRNTAPWRGGLSSRWGRQAKNHYLDQRIGTLDTGQECTPMTEQKGMPWLPGGTLGSC